MLASLNHPNVLRFYGAVVASADDPAVVGIMTEYMRGGSLSHFLTCALPPPAWDARVGRFSLVVMFLAPLPYVHALLVL